MQFRAFFSYSRADERAARWLHRRVDGFRPPKGLAGAEGSHGLIPETLHPIFRDRTDMSGGGALSQRIQDALAESESLIILCSPNAAASEWVNREVEAFIALRRTHRIFPVIAANLPHSDDVERDFFPPALRGLGLLAADLREIKQANGTLIGDGREGGRLKLLAGLLGVGLDQLARRERQRQRTVAMGFAAAALVFAALAVGAGGLGWLWQLSARDATQKGEIAASERDRARDALARTVLERAVAASGSGDTALAARYAMAARTEFPDQAESFDLLLRWVLHEAGGARTLADLDAEALSVAYSPDGARIVVASGDGAAHVFQITDGREVLTLRHAHSSAVLQAAYTPDGRTIVTAGQDDSDICYDEDRASECGQGVFFWNAHTGALTRKLSGSARMFDISDDGRVLAICSERGYSAYTLANLREIGQGLVTFEDNNAPSCVLDATGSLIAYAGDLPISVSPTNTEGDPEAPIAEGADPTVTLLDNDLRLSCAPTHFVGERLALFCDTGPVVVSLDSAHRLLQPEEVNDVWSPPTDCAWTTYYDTQSPTVAMPRLGLIAAGAGAVVFFDANGAIQGSLPGAGPLNSLAASSTGESLAAGLPSGQVRIWRLSDDTIHPCLFDNEQHQQEMSETDEGITLETELVRVEPDQPLRIETIPGDTAGYEMRRISIPSAYQPLHANVNDGGRFLVSVDARQFISVFDAEAGAARYPAFQSAARIESPFVGPDGRLVVTQDTAGIAFWDAANGLQLGLLPFGAFVDDDYPYLLVALDDGEQKLVGIQDTNGDSSEEFYSISEFYLPMDVVLRRVCDEVLAHARSFTLGDIEADPLIAQVWPQERARRDVCANR